MDVLKKLYALGNTRTRERKRAEQVRAEAVRPKWKANTVASCDGMDVEDTEEKVQQYVACVSTGKSKPDG